MKTCLYLKNMCGAQFVTVRALRCENKNKELADMKVKICKTKKKILLTRYIDCPAYERLAKKGLSHICLK